MVQTVTDNGVATGDGVGLEFVADVCLIGAGAAGLAAGRALADRGIAFDWFEKGSMVGGLWRIDNDNDGAAAYKTLHLNSSRPLTQYPSYPMPEDWPDYPSHEMIATYFQSFAEDNHLLERITFRTEVTSVEPLAGDGAPGTHGWAVTIADGQRRTYRNVMVANGHHGAPNIPDFPGSSRARGCTPTTTATRPSSATRTWSWSGSATPGWTSPATRPRSRTGCTW